MWPHYFTLALHGITDDWGECRRLESTAEGEFWCGKPTVVFTVIFLVIEAHGGIEHGSELRVPLSWEAVQSASGSAPTP